MKTLGKPALEALTDQAMAAAASFRPGIDAATLADAEELAVRLAGEFGGSEVTAGRAVLAVSQSLGALLATYEGFPGGLRLVPVVLALAAEQVVREAGST